MSAVRVALTHGVTRGLWLTAAFLLLISAARLLQP